MNWMQFISTIVVFIGTPAIIVYGIYEVCVLAQRMPEQTTVNLEQFARMAVQKVQQQYPDEEKPKKKALAVQNVKMLFEAHPQLKMPSDVAIDIAVESAVFRLPAKE